MESADNFIAIVLGILLLMLLAVGAALLARRFRLPFPIILILSGVLLSQLPLLPSGISVFYDAALTQDTIIHILLPILVFEAAYRFDVARFTANRFAIVLMALPGVLFSTFIITTGILVLTDLSLNVALLLGIILSATDPSATLAIFRDSGAPKNLITIVEGESLLNDATVIALHKIAMMALTLNLSAAQTLANSLEQLVWVFGLGFVAGWLVGLLLLWLIKALPQEPFIEISISLIAAIGCFLLVETYLHASGIIALTTCGLLLAKSAPLPITKNATRYLDSFWDYLSELSKALVFVLVGMWLDIGLIAAHWLTALLVVICMLLARSILVYGILPYVGQLRRLSYSLPRAYQHICLWGGLRGAITLALAMLVVTSSPLFSAAERESLLAVTMGAVLFTIVVQGLTLAPLARRLSLDETSLDEAITKKELMLSAMKRSELALTDLIQTPFSDSGAPQAFLLALKSSRQAEKQQLDHLYSDQVGTEGLYQRLIMRGLSIEAGYLYLLYDQGIISATIYQKQRELFEQQMDAFRHRYTHPSQHDVNGHWLRDVHWLSKRFNRWLGREEKQVAQQYEMAWSRLLTSEFTMSELEERFSDRPLNALLQDRVMAIWRAWHKQSEQVITQLDRQYPLLTADAQRKWLRNMLKTIHKSHLKKYVSQRLLSQSDCDTIIRDLADIAEQPLGGVDNKLRGRGDE